jgi:hypothetical protein
VTLQRRKEKKKLKTALCAAPLKPAAGKNVRNNFVDGSVDLVSILVLAVSLGLVFEVEEGGGGF